MKVIPRQSIYHAEKKQIAGAGSLDIKTCKNYCELVTSNFELKFLLNFLDIWKTFIQTETSDLDKIKKILKITQVSWLDMTSMTKL